MEKITAKIGRNVYTWKLFACDYVLNLIKKDKRFRDVEVIYKKPKEEKPYYWRREDLME